MKAIHDHQHQRRNEDGPFLTQQMIDDNFIGNAALRTRDFQEFRQLVLTDNIPEGIELTRLFDRHIEDIERQFRTAYPGVAYETTITRQETDRYTDPILQRHDNFIIRVRARPNQIPMLTVEQLQAIINTIP